MKEINRRSFLQLSALSPLFLGLSPTKLLAQVQSRLRNLSYFAFDGADELSVYEIDSVIGEIPKDLNISLYKASNGRKIKFGQQLKHFFDGDALAFRIDFNQGRARLFSKYIRTPQYVEEQSQQKMIYDEFGTKATGKRKNNPSINIIPWGKNFLALSESGLPSLLDSQLNFIEYYNFKGTLPGNFSFTAHPKFDPATGELFTFGITQGPTLSLKIFKIDPSTDRATELYSKPQWRYYMIHDMILTPDYVALIIPPVTASIPDLLNTKKTMAEIIKFDRESSTRILIVPRKAGAAPFEIKIPSCMVFHNANGYQQNDKLILHSLLSKNGSLLDVIRNWGDVFRGEFSPSALTRLEIDLNKKELISREELLHNHEFPSWNKAIKDGNVRYLYLTQMGEASDPFHFTAITKYDYQTNQLIQRELAPHEIVGEVLYCAKSQIQEDDGYLLLNGFDDDQKCSYLEILDAKDLNFLARVQLKNHLPIGLHGSLVKS
jgi:all-trans-8'-apo-beta-carotenal 15,15'-oxygenase